MKNVLKLAAIALIVAGSLACTKPDEPKAEEPAAVTSSETSSTTETSATAAPEPTATETSATTQTSATTETSATASTPATTTDTTASKQ